MQCAQVEPAAEAVSESGEISGRILSEVKRMVTPAQTGLEVAQYGVDPLKLGQVLRLPSGDDGRLMCASSRGGGGEAGQPVGEHGVARDRAALGPLSDGLEAEARDGGEPDARRMAVIAERDRGDERDLVLQAPTVRSWPD